MAAADGRGIRLTESADRGRDGITGARNKGSIGFASIRGGDIVGKHDVLFASNGEQLTSAIMQQIGIYLLEVLKSSALG